MSQTHNVNTRIWWRCLALTALVALCLDAAPVRAAEPDFRFRYLGSTVVAMPTGYTRTEALYVADGARSLMFFSYRLLGKFLEVSTTRATNGPSDDDMAWNLKLNILEEDTYIPNICWGLGDFREKFGAKVPFFAASKTIDTFGAIIHVGTVKDPTTNKQNVYYGIDKTIFPLVTLIGERMLERNTVGAKLVPQPNLTLLIAREGVGRSDQHDIYQASYQVNF